jgi:DNA-binding IclR family transcriptional regulator
MAGGVSRPGETVTQRVLSILAVFEARLTSLSLTEIASETGLALSTTHRLIGELEEWGALQRDENGRYQIGIRLWELGQHAGRQMREIARPLLQDLYSLTQETVHIAVREQTDVLYIDRVYGTRRVPRASRVGGRLPMHVTAVGKVILAYEEDWLREAVLARPLEARTARTNSDPVALRAELETVRARGFAVTREEVRTGAVSIAVPIFQGDGAIGAALGLVTTPDRAAGIEQHLPALRGIARRIQASHGPFSFGALRDSDHGGDQVASAQQKQLARAARRRR